MGLIKCPDCGKEISDKSLYCLNCGCPIKKEESQKKFQQSCPNCGNPMEIGSTLCSKCGAMLISVNGVPINRNYTNAGNIKTNNRKKTSSSLAVASMICGIIGLFLSFIYIGILPAIVGFVLAIVAFCVETPKKGMAWAGVITSILGVLMSVVIYGNDVDSRNKEETEKSTSHTMEAQQKDMQENNAMQEEEEEKIILIDPGEIYNGNDVSIVISEIEQAKSETTITFLLTSTSEKDYAISAHTYAVNGLMAGGNVVGSDVDLPAGKKAKFSVEIDNQWLEENGIEKIAQLDFLFWAYGDSVKEWDTGIIELKTNLYEDSIMYSPSGEEVYSDQHVTLWYTGNIGNDYSFIIKNNNSYNSDYTVDNCSINDWSYKILNYTYDLYNEQIHANSYDVFTLSVNSDFMEEYNISQIESIEFNVLLGNETTEKIIIEQ